MGCGCKKGQGGAEVSSVKIGTASTTPKPKPVVSTKTTKR